MLNDRCLIIRQIKIRQTQKIAIHQILIPPNIPDIRYMYCTCVCYRSTDLISIIGAAHKMEEESEWIGSWIWNLPLSSA